MKWITWLLHSDSPKAKSIRTWVQGLAFDVAAAVSAAVIAAVQTGSLDVTSKAGLIALVVLVGKTAVMAAAAWFMARYRLNGKHYSDRWDRPSTASS
ncbi:hypothetical protein [Kribbella catacumbae]|uniref:hypothetical protein n=1 Tax=Kribbella catacumbae TaxID=460086 RepID=UPI00037444EB|nr:hypothetical protein [Kribbella catacumbae]